MKTIITRTTVFCLIFLLSSFLKAQNDQEYAYRGGNADGFASETVENVSCGTPFHHFAYFGGNADGSATETLENAVCSATPYHQFAYFGGDADGAATETVADKNCDTPYHFYAYFGGIGDGFAMGKTTDTCPIAPPVANFTANKTEICQGQSILFTDASTNKPTGWTWTFDGGSPGTASTKTVNVTYNTPGVYQVKLVAANYIGNDTVTKMAYITVKSTADCSSLGTSDADKMVKTKVYPNPTKDILYIKSPTEVQSIEIFDVSGRKVMGSKPSQKDVQINLEKFNSGVYILKSHTKSGVETYKVIKRD